MKTTQSLRSGGVLVAMLAAAVAYAHGPQLKVDRTKVAAGESMTASGEGIASNGPIHLKLRGVLRDDDLGTTQGDEHGRFRMTLTVPADLAPGEYTLIASGKETATLRLTVTAAAESAQPAAGRAAQQAPIHPAGHAAAPGAEAREAQAAGGAGVEARDEPMPLGRSRNAGELVIVWATILMSAAIGTTLLVRRG